MLARVMIIVVAIIAAKFFILGWRAQRRGTGLLSSAGELEAMQTAELRPFDLEAASRQEYDPTKFQPVLFCADSFETMFETLKDYLLRWSGGEGNGCLNNVQPPATAGGSDRHSWCGFTYSGSCIKSAMHFAGNIELSTTSYTL